MKWLFTIFLVVSSTTFLVFGDDVDANEILERRELMKDIERYEKDDMAAIREYKIDEIADNAMEDTYTEERRRPRKKQEQKCIPNSKGCHWDGHCCKDEICKCDFPFGGNCECEPKP